ncbi:DmpA family aminopeptidase [Sphingomonas sp. IC-11]|uniref:DmpA family aminopeptidase n=1 Tax=Sphingomonas sp. IC-11 TaxID=2898528 RepID=UPI002ED910ED
MAKLGRLGRLIGCAMLGSGLLAMSTGLRADPAQPAPTRAREAGIRFGILTPGPLNAITDVTGVRVGHATLVDGERVHTGVTAIFPHGDNLFQNKVPAGFSVGNGFGKFAGSTQVEELGELETPILLTNTLSVPEAAAATIEWTLAQPGNDQVQSVNAVVGETNDSFLNDIRARTVTIATAREAITAAKPGPVAEGAVGAGAGTVAFGYKGGIGTSSRVLPKSLGGHTIGVLVQSNYGGVLTIAGMPVGERLGGYLFEDAVDRKQGDGSIIVVIATNAPLSDRNLKRLAARAFLGIARTGSPMTNGSGDYAIAFSTHADVRRTQQRRGIVSSYPDVGNDQMTPLFQAVSEATEEAVINSLFAGQTVKGYRGTVDRLPVEKVVAMWRQMHRSDDPAGPGEGKRRR